MTEDEDETPGSTSPSADSTAPTADGDRPLLDATTHGTYEADAGAPKAADPSSVGVSVRLEVADGVVTDAALSFHGIAELPLRVPEAEASLIGRVPTRERFADAAAIAGSHLSPNGAAGAATDGAVPAAAVTSGADEIASVRAADVGVAAAELAEQALVEAVEEDAPS